jgi:hypothetical protein
LKINSEEIKLSYILELKALFRSFSGSTPIEIEFFDRNAKFALLFIDAKWGVQFNKQLEEKIKAISPFITIQWE